MLNSTDTLTHLNTNIAQLVSIQTQALTQLNKPVMLDPTFTAKLSALFDIVTKLIAATDPAVVADLKAQLAAEVANDDTLNALLPQIDTLSTAAAAAVPAAPVVPPPAA